MNSRFLKCRVMVPYPSMLFFCSGYIIKTTKKNPLVAVCLDGMQ